MCVWEYGLSFHASFFWLFFFSSLRHIGLLSVSVCLCKSARRSYAAAASVCDVVWVSYQGHGGHVTVREGQRGKSRWAALTVTQLLHHPWIHSLKPDAMKHIGQWRGINCCPLTSLPVLSYAQSVIGSCGVEGRNLNGWTLQKLAFGGVVISRRLSRSAV